MGKSTYIAIDLKSFYASVECVERKLDPLTTNLVVADASRTDKTICLAVSPSMKSHGIPGRPRLLKTGASRPENHGSTLRYLRNIIANDTPTVILRSHIQVFVVPGSTLFIHLKILSLCDSASAGAILLFCIGKLIWRKFTP